ncbi:MAG TPA: hypothetical protein VKR23_08240 [Gaiellaceae bacterium]|nr:hypothetical protein [Gaiellaceae bacterium]
MADKERRDTSGDRRTGKDRRKRDDGPPGGKERRTAGDRRSGKDRRRP